MVLLFSPNAPYLSDLSRVSYCVLEKCWTVKIPSKGVRVHFFFWGIAYKNFHPWGRERKLSPVTCCLAVMMPHQHLVKCWLSVRAFLWWNKKTSTEAKKKNSLDYFLGGFSASPMLPGCGSVEQSHHSSTILFSLNIKIPVILLNSLKTWKRLLISTKNRCIW